MEVVDTDNHRKVMGSRLKDMVSLLLKGMEDMDLLLVNMAHRLLNNTEVDTNSREAMALLNKATVNPLPITAVVKSLIVPKESNLKVVNNFNILK